MLAEQPVEKTFEQESETTKQQRFLIVGAKMFEVYEDTTNWKISPLL
jgi:hypothetical protein